MIKISGFVLKAFQTVQITFNKMVEKGKVNTYLSGVLTSNYCNSSYKYYIGIFNYYQFVITKK